VFGGQRSLSTFIGLRDPCANFHKLSGAAFALNRKQSFDLIFVAMAAYTHIAAGGSNMKISRSRLGGGSNGR
jgi:hypothetical protein